MVSKIGNKLHKIRVVSKPFTEPWISNPNLVDASGIIPVSKAPPRIC